MRTAVDLARQLDKVHDVLVHADRHFAYEAQMNAELHMAAQVRPAPLAVAVTGARDDLRRLILELQEEAP